MEKVNQTNQSNTHIVTRPQTFNLLCPHPAKQNQNRKGLMLTATQHTHRTQERNVKKEVQGKVAPHIQRLKTTN